MDDNGCTTCHCNDPCDVVKCSKNEECVPTKCMIPPCKPPATCVSKPPPVPGVCPVVPPGTVDICVDLCSSDADCHNQEKCCSNGCGHVCKKPCSPFICLIFCAYGNKMDGNGCPLCACNDPCDVVKCAKDEECVPTKCLVSPCKPPATCVKLPVVKKCPVGKPLQKGGVDVFCGRGPNSKECPGGFFCNTDPADRFAVCCLLCQLPKDKGPCKKLTPRYYFDVKMNMCKQFKYGGCQGNANNFKTKKECIDWCEPCPIVDCFFDCPVKFPVDGRGCKTSCECDMCKAAKCSKGQVCINVPGDCGGLPCAPKAKCVDICDLPKKVGPCKALIPRYYFDTELHQCKQFKYGGCEGNANNFKTAVECYNQCQPCPIVDCFFNCPVPFPVNDRGCQTGCECDVCAVTDCSKGQVCINVPGDCGGLPCAPKAKCVDPCTLPKKVGPCEAAVPRYYYDSITKMCTFFEYGGCEANANNFESKAECEKQCSASSDKCLVGLPLTNSTTGAEIFCGRGPNRQDCPSGYFCKIHPTDKYAVCCSICALPKEVGPCKALIPRYYFDTTMHHCKKFNYGGCEGNANNFGTAAECYRHCQPCPIVDCFFACPVAFPTDERGCQTGCECDICTVALCPVGTICISVPGQCGRVVCAPEARCVDPCTLPMEVGPCEDEIDRYYYDPSENKCKLFSYGGCGANANNFKTLQACQERCHKVVCKKIICNLDCRLKRDKDGCKICKCDDPCEEVVCPVGQVCVEEDVVCKKAPCPPVTRCVLSRMCPVGKPLQDAAGNQVFCGRGPNRQNCPPGYYCNIDPVDRFAVCCSICSLPMEVGPCEALMPRYFYDNVAKKCKHFNYGGCQGNKNNFMTLAGCQRTCVTECPVMVCNKKCTLMKDAKGCDICECEDPCEEKKCPAGEVCIAKKVQCVRAPCPPIATCVKRCNLPKEPGTCKGFFPRYYYDYETGLCKRFIYGGCLGNANRFLTLSDCLEECSPGVCELPKKPGPCRGSFLRYYFDSSDKKCKKFIYGGCEGNGNNFKTVEECMKTCIKVCDPIRCPIACEVVVDNDGCPQCDCSPPDVCKGVKCKPGQECVPVDVICVTSPCPPHPECVDICNLPKDPGPCEGWFPRYYYDSSEGECKKFFYGGCQGNSNNFQSLDECRKQCQPKCPPLICSLECTLKTDTEGCAMCECEDPCETVDCPEGQVCTTQEVQCIRAPCPPIVQCVDKCNLPKDPGPCRAYVPSYYYDSDEGICKQFIYGGCLGNANRFKTLQECSHTCVPDVCTLPAKTGMCFAYFPRYYYDHVEKTCKKFIYGGCGANANNFKTLHECFAMCMPDCPPFVCPLICDVIHGDGGCPHCDCSHADVCKDFECKAGQECVPVDVVCVTEPCLPDPQCFDVCHLPKVIGRCRAYLPRYYYDSADGICKKFYYGGCGGNGNKFKTLTECYDQCSPGVCKLPKVKGPCLAWQPRYYYDYAESRCTMFIYGGCQGNANNFGLLPDCIKACDSDCPPIKCPLSCDLTKTAGGCYVCDCGPPDVCKDFKCPEGQFCTPLQVFCIRAPCPPIPVCVDCPLLDCDLSCELMKDGNGCDVCECRDPCEEVQCGTGYECIVVRIQCVTTPCLPDVGQCIDIDECMRELDNCTEDERCVNHGGGYRCLSSDLPDLPCTCWIEGDPMVSTYDKTLKLIIDEQKTLLSRGQNPDKFDRCKFQSRAVTDDDFPGKEGQVYVSWVAFSFGIHPGNSEKYLRAIQIFQDKVLIRGHGLGSEQEVGLPYSFATYNNPSGDPVTVHVTESNGVVSLVSDDCPWSLEFVRGGFNSKIHLAVGDRYKPSQNSGRSMDGICGNCDGIFDYRLCGPERTDVSDEEDKYKQISESCADGKHQQQD